MTVWISLFSFFSICAIAYLFACTYYIDKDVSTTNLRVSELQNSVRKLINNLADVISTSNQTAETCSNSLKVVQEKDIRLELDISEMKSRVDFLATAIQELEKRVESVEKQPEQDAITPIFVVDDGNEPTTQDEPTKIDTEVVVMEPVNETKKEKTVKKSTPKKTSNKSTAKKKTTQSTKKA